MCLGYLLLSTTIRSIHTTQYTLCNNIRYTYTWFVRRLIIIVIFIECTFLCCWHHRPLPFNTTSLSNKNSVLCVPKFLLLKRKKNVLNRDIIKREFLASVNFSIFFYFGKDSFHLLQNLLLIIKNCNYY